MKRNGLNKLLWTALGIHVLYFLCLTVLAIFQKQVMGLYMHRTDEIYLFSVPFLIAGALACLIIHIVLTGMLVRQSLGERSTVFWGGMAAAVFGVAFPCINQLGRLIVQGFINRRGSNAIAGYSVFGHAAAWIAPVRMAGISLLLLAAGMVIHGKLRNRTKGSMNHKKLAKWLWGSLGLDAVFFVIMMAIVVFQNPLKQFFHYPEIMFVFPGLLVVGYCIFLLIHLCLTIIMVNQLKQGSEVMICEIIGMLLYGGILGWFGLYFNYFTSYLVGRAGYIALANFGAVNGFIYFFCPVRTIGINLFILCCGMTVDRKFMKSHPQHRD